MMKKARQSLVSHEQTARTIGRLVLALILCCLHVSAQSARATLFGSVADPTGAPIAGAQVELTHEATGAARATKSNSAGQFIFPLLEPGAYRVTVSRDGFKKETRLGLAISVGEKARLDVRLEVGEVSDEVIVNPDGSPLASGASGIDQVIDRRRMSGLPLNERAFLPLALLAPGAAPPAPESRLSTQSNSGINASGGREASNNFLLDGADNNDLFLNRFVVNPSIDAVEEFRLQTSGYDAEYGRSAGAQVNVTTRSGGNATRATLYEFFRNSRLDAKNFFDLADRPIPRFQRHQYGGSLGGPIKKHRTFYFANFEGFNLRRAETRTSNVPTAAQKAGDFSGTGVTLFDPFTGSPFPGNRIPESRIHPVGRAIVSLYPDPNRAGGSQNYVAAPIARGRAPQFNFRFDHRFTPATTLTARYSFIDDERHDPFNPKGPNLPGFGLSILDRGQNLVISSTQTLSPRAINELRLGYNRLRREVFPENRAIDGLKALGIESLTLPERDFGFPSVVIAGYEKLGDDPNIPVVRRTGTYHISDHISIERGRQALKAGGEIRHYLENGYNDLFARGQLNLQPSFTGDALADLLLGLPTLSILAVNDNPQALRTTAYNLFVQNDWRVTPRLTLNLGLRYEYNSPPVDARDRLVVYDVEKQKLIAAGSEGVPRAGIAADRNNFAPRAGLSWEFAPRTVLRAGYGIYFDSGTLIENSALYFNPPYFRLNLYFTSAEQLLTLDDPFAAGGSFTPLPSPVTLERGFRTGEAQHWSLGVARELPRGILFDIYYVGKKGTHLVRKRNLNQPVPGAGDLDERRPIAGFGDILLIESAASSSYHALQARAEKRYLEDLSLVAAYTWSKSIDDASSFLESKGDDNTPQNSRNLRAERGLSNFDLRHRFSLGFIYDLPLARAARGWRRGWQLSGIIAAQTGRPFTPRLATDNSNTGNVGGFFAFDRPDLVGEARVERPRPERWFNTDAFAIAPRYSFGTAGRNILTGPGYASFDFALSKRIPIGDEREIVARAECFNCFNRPNFNLPESFIDNRATFGRVLSAGPARQIQLSLRINF